ncbi:MAG: hypothetical protein RSE64_01690 [Oscillospiraceae bacterium]
MDWKNIFLFDLTKRLALKFSYAETSDVVRDYDDYIEAAKASGKSELEIIGSLDKPRAVIAALSAELPKKKLSLRPAVIFAALGMCLLIYLAFFSGIYADYSAALIVKTGLFTLFFPKLLWIFLGCGSLARFSAMNSKLDNPKKELWLLHGLLFLFPVSIVGIFAFGIMNSNSISNPATIGSIFTGFLILLLCASVLLLIYAAVRSLVSSIRYFTLCTHACGVIAFCAAFYGQMKFLTKVEFAGKMALLCTIVYVLGLAASLVCVLYTNALLKKGEAEWMRK